MAESISDYINSHLILDFSDSEKRDFFGSLNKDFVELIFDFMRLADFEPYDINYGNTYFIFSSNPNSIITFKVKGLSKHWRFGMWVHSEALFKEEQNTHPIEVFAQWDTQIDKFKPSRSALLVQYSKPDVFNLFDTNYNTLYAEHKIQSMLKYMQMHPILAYFGLVDDIGMYPTFRFLPKFIKNESEELYYQYEEIAACQLATMYAKRKIEKFRKQLGVLSVQCQSCIGDDWISSTRIRVIVEFEESLTDDEITKIIDKVLPSGKDEYFKFGRHKYNVGVKFEYYVGDYTICYD